MNVFKFTFLLFVFIIIETDSYCQKFADPSAKTYSIWQTYKVQKNDTNQINYYLSIGDSFLSNNPDTTLFFYQKAISLAKDFYVSSQKQSNQQTKMAELIIAECYKKMGVAFYYKNNYQKAIDYTNKSLNIFKKHDHKNGLIRCFNNLGVFYKSQYMYSKSVKYYFQSLKLAEELGDKISISDCYNNIGNVFYYQDNLNKALEYLKKSFIIRKNIRNKERLADSYINIANVYNKINENDSAIDCTQNALVILNETGNKRDIALCYNNLGIYNRDKGRLHKALEYFAKSIGLSETLGERGGLVISYTNMAGIYIILKDYNSAIKMATRGLDISKDIGALHEERKNYKHLKNSYGALGDYKKAFEYSNLYIQLNDTLYNLENTKTINELENKYQSEKKESEITILKKNEELHTELLKRQQFKTAVISILAGLLLITFVLLYFYSRAKQKNRLDKELINHKMEQIKAVIETQEKERKRFARDIHDGIGQYFSALNTMV